MEPNSSRAKRLGYVLKRYSEDNQSVEKIAEILNYVPGDLIKDMNSIDDYIQELERKIEYLEEK